MDVALGFKPIKCGIDGADRHVPVGAGFDLLTYSDSVSAIFQLQKRKDHDVLKFA